MHEPSLQASTAARAAPRFRMEDPPAHFLRLGLNESALGPSPHVAAAIQSAAVGRYPTCGATALRASVAERNGLNRDSIVCGQGTEELIRLICRAYLDPGDEAIHEAMGFGVFRTAIAAAGGVAKAAANTGFSLDIDRVLAAVGPRTRMVLLANPNNPTGATAPWPVIADLLQRLPANVLLVHDAAYAEYATDIRYQPGHQAVEFDDRLVVMRTFSKAYGLANLRAGWMHASVGVVDAINRIRPLYNVAGVAEAAALAALGDDQHLRRVLRSAEESTRRYRLESDRFGIQAILGNTNFVCFPSAPGLADAYQNAEIAVHSLERYALPAGVRVSFGSEADDDRALAVLRTWAQFNGRPACEPASAT